MAMMAEKNGEVDTERVKNSVETGEYFAAARNWYDVIYHRPLGERSFFILLTFFAFVTILFSVLVYLSMFPLNRITPYIIRSDDLAEDIPFIRNIKAVPEEDLNVSVARFLVQNYVGLREEYRYDVNKLEQDYNRLRVTTADKEFSAYQELVSPQNPASPYNKYGRNMVREVAISGVQLSLNTTPKTAKVYFTTTLVDGINQQQESWEATISYQFPTLVVDQNTNKVLQWSQENNSFTQAEQVIFVVESYETQQLGMY